MKDPETVEKLLPTDHPLGSKRALIDTDYYETYNRDNVELVDIRHSQIEAITPSGIRTEDDEYDFDMIIFATGFDAMTGTFLKMDIRGRVAGFPNMFMITGPGSPSVLSNMTVSIEQHQNYIADFIDYMRDHDIEVAEADGEAEVEWVAHVNKIAEPNMLADSWYLGANIPGKPRVFMPYAGGVGSYREKCNEIADNDYEGFILSGGVRA